MDEAIGRIHGFDAVFAFDDAAARAGLSSRQNCRAAERRAVGGRRRLAHRGRRPT